jgi:ABC-2 type transport system permease protein
MKIWNLTKKDLAVIFKDRGALLWLFVLPVVFIVIFAGLASLAQGGSSGDTADDRTALTVVNLDPGGELTDRFLADLDRAGGYRVELSEPAAAQDRIEKIKIIYYLVIPENFSANLAAGTQVVVQLITHPDANVQNVQSVAQVINGVAKDTSLELQLLDGISQLGEMQAGNPQAEEAFQADKVAAQAKSQFEQSKITPLVGVIEREPIVDEADEAPEFDLASSAVPGMTVLFVFLAASTVARGIYEERKNGSLRRLLSAPLTRTELMLGKMTPIFLLTLVQIVVIFLFGAFILPLLGIGRLGIGKDPLALVLTSIFIALCSTSMGIMISAIARTEGQISGLSNALLWVAGFLGGALIPSFLIQQIPVLAVLSRLVPHSWATQAFYDLIARGLGLVDVLPSLGMLLLFSAVFFFIGVRRFKFE